jgi:hypothetical protein
MMHRAAFPSMLQTLPGGRFESGKADTTHFGQKTSIDILSAAVRQLPDGFGREKIFLRTLGALIKICSQSGSLRNKLFEQPFA